MYFVFCVSCNLRLQSNVNSVCHFAFVHDSFIHDLLYFMFLVLYVSCLLSAVVYYCCPLSPSFNARVASNFTVTKLESV